MPSSYVRLPLPSLPISLSLLHFVPPLYKNQLWTWDRIERLRVWMILFFTVTVAESSKFVRPENALSKGLVNVDIYYFFRYFVSGGDKRGYCYNSIFRVVWKFNVPVSPFSVESKQSSFQLALQSIFRVFHIWIFQAIIDCAASWAPCSRQFRWAFLKIFCTRAYPFCSYLEVPAMPNEFSYWIKQLGQLDLGVRLHCASE